MNNYVTASVIKELREKNNLTQAELAKILHVSDKTVSKWEMAKGYPDISLLEPIAEAFNVSVTELLSGNTISNMNLSANVMKSKFYVCPICGNVIFGMGEAVITCHGIQLTPCTSEDINDSHKPVITHIEDEYYVRIEHDITKNHYISFIAAVSPDKIQLVKLYPEGNAEARFKINGVKKIYFYCNNDGLFRIENIKNI
ncbi:MAG: helix-turn-helix domain-containing protein [Ruminococcaceae bacterium]|nr:helix-turn-helix domain-containing protein [Oscillospiraceae bacterium]